MSCGRTHLLESLVEGELASGLEQELRAHAGACPRCRHELNWLEAERRLFRQRAGRDEVHHLWQGVAAKKGDRPRALGRVLVALAASVALVLGVGQWSQGLRGTRSSDASVELLSEPVQSGGFEEVPICSAFASGLGFHCGPAVPASFIASR